MSFVLCHRFSHSVILYRLRKQHLKLKEPLNLNSNLHHKLKKDALNRKFSRRLKFSPLQ